MYVTVLICNFKQKAYGPHRSPEQKFLETFYFVAYVISILSSEPPLWGLVLIRGLKLTLTI